MGKPEMYAQRRTQLLSALSPHSAILLSHPSDISYYSGFAEFLLPREREALLYCDAQQTILFYPPLTTIPPFPSSIKQVASIATANVVDVLVRQQQEAKCQQLVVDMQSLCAAEYVALQTEKIARLVPLDRKLIWEQRSIKDEAEIALIERSAQIALQAFAQIQPTITHSMTELQLARVLDRTMQEFGAECSAFPTIVAFAEHTALAHHQPTNRPLQQNQAIMIDFGAKYEGYCSDMTRSFWFGESEPEEYTQLKHAVDAAYEQVIRDLRGKALATASAIDQAVRLVFSRAKLEHLFTHTTGHGLGLDIHEPPSLNSRNQEILKPGMVITIEPGVYRQGSFGYRHENTVVITEDSAIVLE